MTATAAIAERRARLGGTETRVLSVDGDGPALALLHGWGESADSWRPFFERAAAAGRRALAADLPGFGRADELEPGAVLPQFERFAAAFVEHARDDGGDVVLVAHSVSGLTALRLAARDAIDVHGLVVIAPLGPERSWWQALAARDPGVLSLLLKVPLPVPMAVARPIAAELFKRGGFAEPDALDPEVVDTYFSHYPDMRSLAKGADVGLRVLREVEAPADLSDVGVPALVVWGAQDRVVGFDSSRTVREALAGVRVELVDGAGHVPHLEAPDVTAELLLAFPTDQDRRSDL